MVVQRAENLHRGLGAKGGGWGRGTLRGGIAYREKMGSCGSGGGSCRGEKTPHKSRGFGFQFVGVVV